MTLDIREIIKKNTVKVDKFPKKFFEDLPLYGQDDFLATLVFPAWDGFGITDASNWVLLTEEDIDYVAFVDDENEDEQFGWLAYTHNGDVFYTLEPNRPWNQSAKTIIQEIRYKM